VLAAEGSVFGSPLPGYWLDVGTPESYLQAHRDVLERVFETAVGDALGPDFTLVDESADVHA
jgi:mannose-1-phosphate guanylyltransferase